MALDPNSSSLGAGAGSAAREDATFKVPSKDPKKKDDKKDENLVCFGAFLDSKCMHGAVGGGFGIEATGPFFATFGGLTSFCEEANEVKAAAQLEDGDESVEELQDLFDVMFQGDIDAYASNPYQSLDPGMCSPFSSSSYGFYRARTSSSNKRSSSEMSGAPVRFTVLLASTAVSKAAVSRQME